MLDRTASVKLAGLTLGLLVLVAGTAFAGTTTVNWSTAGGGNGALAYGSTWGGPVSGQTQATFTAFTAQSMLNFAGDAKAWAVPDGFLGAGTVFSGTVDLAVYLQVSGTWQGTAIWTGWLSQIAVPTRSAASSRASRFAVTW